jgi:predicted membrane protein
MTLMDYEQLKQILTGTVGSVHMTEGFLLGASILMEIPIAMVLLSRILKYKSNRWANIVAGSIKTVVMIASMFVGTPTLYYLFFGTIEMACTAFIVWYAWTWTDPDRKIA